MPAVLRRPASLRVVLAAAAGLVAILVIALRVPAQPEPARPSADAPARATTDVSQLAFLAGHWRADLGGMQVEEVWLAPAGGNMTAAFRMIPKDCPPTLFEIVTIDQGPAGPEMRLRHFDPGLVPWEAEADGPLHLPRCGLEGTSVVFRPAEGASSPVTSISYERTGDRMVATVALAEGDRFVIPFERVEAEAKRPSHE